MELEFGFREKVFCPGRGYIWGLHVYQTVGVPYLRETYLLITVSGDPDMSTQSPFQLPVGDTQGFPSLVSSLVFCALSLLPLSQSPLLSQLFLETKGVGG